MSAETVLATIGNDVKGFYAKLSADFQKARQVWLLVSSAQTRSLLLTLGADAIKTVKDAAVAVDAKGFSIAIDEAVFADIQKLIADAKAGDNVIAEDLRALGITL